MTSRSCFSGSQVTMNSPCVHCIAIAPSFEMPNHIAGSQTHALHRSRAIFHIYVCRFYQLSECGGINVTSRPELHMAHELAVAFHHFAWIRKFGAEKEPHVDMGREGIHIAKRRIMDTCSWMAVMQ